MSKIKEELYKWREILCSWIGRLNNIKMSILTAFGKLILKFIWRDRRTRTANAILDEENTVGTLRLLHLKTYYKAILVKTVVLVKE